MVLGSDFDDYLADGVGFYQVDYTCLISCE